VRQHDRRVKPKGQDEVALPRTGLSYLELLMREHREEAKAALGRISFHRPQPPEKEDESDV
jgi:hypothetical protein